MATHFDPVIRADASGGGQAAFSLPQTRRIVADLLVPNPAIYWADFLTTILLGHLCFALVRQLPPLVGGAAPGWIVVVCQAAAFLASCFLYYRAVMFIHELVHLPQHKFRLFRVVWNLLCGIPLLTPSFTYATHLDHHRRRSYGTHDDGEYFALARVDRWYAVFYFTQGLLLPPLAVFRFLILTPLTWLSPQLRRWVHQRASSLVVDPLYLRPLPTAAEQQTIRLQELLVFLWCLGIAVAIILIGDWPYPFLIQGYATGAMVMSINAVRTATAHRWQSDGRELSLVAQLLDTVTIDSNSPLDVLLCPVGLRFHALHHLFPTLPYHNARAAHQRLLAALPANSPYRATIERSVVGALAKLWGEARERRTGFDTVLADETG
jgi:fatty acid desaturase